MTPAAATRAACVTNFRPITDMSQIAPTPDLDPKHPKSNTPETMQIFSAEQIHAALPWPALVEQLARAFADGADV